MNPKHWQTPTALALLLASSCGDTADAGGDASLIQTVTRSDLVVNVRESGELVAHHQQNVVSEVEGSARLIYLIDEGAHVTPGVKLAELDVSEVREKRAAHGITVARARATLDQALKNVAIMEKEIESAEQTAESRLLIAELRERKLYGLARPAGPTDQDSTHGTNQEMADKLRDLIESETDASPAAMRLHRSLLQNVLELLGPPDELQEHLRLDMGEISNQILLVIDGISLARVDLKMAKETLSHSKNLVAKDFITKNEYERDEIAYRRALSKVTLAWNNLQLLVQYTLKETKIERQQEVENARLGLESVKATSEARRVRERAELASAQAEYDLAKKRLDNLDAQIRFATIRAPSPGVVVYSYSRRRRGRIRLGDDIDQRQSIVTLPDTRKMVAKVLVHEAQIGKVAVGQGATVRIDALPGQALTGRVSEVSSLPDSTNWRNPELKLYKVNIDLDRDNTDNELRPGMTAAVVVHAGVLHDVLNIPALALHRRGNHAYVFKATPAGPVAQRVSLGANNLTHVEVLDGLAAGDRIHLVQPPGAALPDPPPAPSTERLEGVSGRPQGAGGEPIDATSAGRVADDTGK